MVLVLLSIKLVFTKKCENAQKCENARSTEGKTGDEATPALRTTGATKINVYSYKTDVAWHETLSNDVSTALQKETRLQPEVIV